MIKTTEIKSLLKQAGIDTKQVRVNQERSYIYVRLMDYNINRDVVEATLKPLHTVKNISHDLDSIYVGTSVQVLYHATPDTDLTAHIKTELEMMPDFSINRYDSVQRASIYLQMNSPERYKHLSRYDWVDLVHKVGG